ncbi:MAG: TerB family tellurite resistance protein, partial [Bacteroidota bacterium]
MIQEEETEVLSEVLQNHPWGKEIQWSFDYERKKKHSLRATYFKALETLKEHGPDPDYQYLVEVLEKVAAAADGFTKKEGIVISNMQKTLRSHFKNYLGENELL